MVCVGDSITRGQISSDWVSLLHDGHPAPHTVIANEGVNGELAWNLLQRLDTVIAADPDDVVLMIGTNDVGFTQGGRWEVSYRRHQRLPTEARPTPEWYLHCMSGIVERLRMETTARVVIVDIPPYGEDLESRLNSKVSEYNRGLHRLAGYQGIPVIPLHDRLRDLIAEGPGNKLARSPWRILATVTQHAVLRRSWDRIAQANGLTVLTDGVHLSDRAGAIMADLVSTHLEAIP